MKKTILIAIGLIILLAACDRKMFVKKIVGTWKINKYLFSGIDKTTMFDTTNRNWQLTLGNDQVYTKSWQSYFLRQDSLTVFDTLGFDTVNSIYIVDTNIYHYTDTFKTPHLETGQWDLLNSEEDLQLRNASSNAVEIYRILDLSKNNLNLRKGNEEFYLQK